MRSKIINEVSISEMQTMRERGMTNQEIADSLDISYGAVYNHIGKQPKGLRGCKRPKSKTELAVTNGINVSTLELVSRIEQYTGEYGKYTVYNDNVTFELKEPKLSLTAQEFEKFIVELIDIKGRTP